MKGNLGIFNIRGFALVTSAVLTISVLSACSGGGGATAPQNLPPVGSLDAVDLSPQHIVGPAPRTVQFTATYSDPENRLSSAILDFGDGESTTLTAPNSVVSHSYRQEGFYQPRLLLSDDVPGRTVTIYVNNDSSFRIMVTAPLPPPALTVVIEGRGRVDSEPDYPGISCPSDCNEDYSQGSMVTLIVTPENGWRFDGWGKDCGGPLTALPVRIQGIKTCVAHFSQIYYTLRVTTEGAGRVNSDAPGINCPGDCSESYPALTPVGLTATPDPGWVFEGWTGACTGPNATTQVAITSDKTCTARFTQTHQLNVAVTGQGSVSSNPVGINCPGDCSEVYLTLTVVTLTATPAPGWGFLNWSGDCSGSLPTFGITVNALKNCTAIFAPVYPLNVSVIGSGTVQSNPTGINCPPDCSEPYFVNTSVSLSARPVPGWGFAGWSGDCSGTHPTTQVTLDSARNCTATFKILRTLSVITNGQGSVSSNPAGVSCPSDCSEPYLTDSLITLTATPADGWTFANWTGDCSGSDPSTSVNLNTDKTCAANFVQLWYDLSLTVNGQGSVSSNPAGINCPAGNCTASFPSYTLVTLTATAFPGWVFAGWSGACSGTSPSLQVTLNTPKACTATFSQTPPLTVTLNGQGSVSSNPAGINCPADCSENYLIGSTVTLTATPANGWAFANWSGDCSGSNSSIQVFMDAGKACTAN
ncbi:MAG: InlB B-repeat-containing protein, partial [bacterium JZ-2024 1]